MVICLKLPPPSEIFYFYFWKTEGIQRKRKTDGGGGWYLLTYFSGLIFFREGSRLSRGGVEIFSEGVDKF